MIKRLPFGSRFNSYFIGVKRVSFNAVVSVFCQIAKIVLTVILVNKLAIHGTATAVHGLCLGITLTEILGFFLIFIEYIFDRQRTKVILKQKRSDIRSVSSMALPLALSAYVRSVLLNIEHILIPKKLRERGESTTEAYSHYGILHGMALPLITYPMSPLSSFAGLLVPEVAQANAEKKSDDIERIVSNVFETALIFAIGTAGIMVCFSYELGNIIYPDTDAGRYIRMIAPLIPVMYLDTAVDAMLKGLGEQVYSMGVNIIDSLLSVILVVILLPLFGIEGYILTVYFTELVNATLSITRLLNVSKIKPFVFSRVIKPLFSIVIASSAVKILSETVNIPFPSMLFEAVFSISLTITVYVLLLILLGSLKEKKIKKAVKLMLNK